MEFLTARLKWQWRGRCGNSVVQTEEKRPKRIPVHFVFRDSKGKYSVKDHGTRIALVFRNTGECSLWQTVAICSRPKNRTGMQHARSKCLLCYVIAENIKQTKLRNIRSKKLERSVAHRNPDRRGWKVCLCAAGYRRRIHAQFHAHSWPFERGECGKCALRFMFSLSGISPARVGAHVACARWYWRIGGRIAERWEKHIALSLVSALHAVQHFIHMARR